MSTFETSEWQAWIQAIIANPADDLVRLACCDWLEEHGETDRAELI